MAIGSKVFSPGAGLRVLAICMGVFLFFMGFDKIPWLTDPGILAGRFQEWRGMAAPFARWYLETIAIPGVAVFARIVPIAEMAAGIALLVGVRTRLAAALAFLMVVNIHIASDVMLRYEYLTNGYGPPILGGLAALAIGGARLPFSAGK
jgi:uncharacterized membrane protein YphA (DoxX/SURF4 family)